MSARQSGRISMRSRGGGARGAGMRGAGMRGARGGPPASPSRGGGGGGRGNSGAHAEASGPVRLDAIAAALAADRRHAQTRHVLVFNMLDPREDAQRALMHAVTRSPDPSVVIVLVGENDGLMCCVDCGSRCKLSDHHTRGHRVVTVHIAPSGERVADAIAGAFGVVSTVAALAPTLREGALVTVYSGDAASDARIKGLLGAAFSCAVRVASGGVASLPAGLFERASLGARLAALADSDAGAADADDPTAQSTSASSAGRAVRGGARLHGASSASLRDRVFAAAELDTSVNLCAVAAARVKGWLAREREAAHPLPKTMAALVAHVRGLCAVRCEPIVDGFTLLADCAREQVVALCGTCSAVYMPPGASLVRALGMDVVLRGGASGGAATDSLLGVLAALARATDAWFAARVGKRVSIETATRALTALASVVVAVPPDAVVALLRADGWLLSAAAADDESALVLANPFPSVPRELAVRVNNRPDALARVVASRLETSAAFRRRLRAAAAAGAVAPATSFAAMSLPLRLLMPLASFARAPTALQSTVLPPMLAGAHVAFSGPAQSGKTLALVLSMVGRTIALAPAHGLAAVFVAASREAAVSAHMLASTVASEGGRTVVLAVGGLAVKPQVRELARGGTIVVGTIGRLVDLLVSRVAVPLDGVRVFAVDDADFLCESARDGLAELLDALKAASPAVQRLAASAFASERVLPLLPDAERDSSVHVTASPEPYVPSSTRHHQVVAARADEVAALAEQLASLRQARARLVLVFCTTRRSVEAVCGALIATHGFPTALMFHDSLDMVARRDVLAAAAATTSFLPVVCTDAWARGVAFRTCDAVVLLGLPRGGACGYALLAGRLAAGGLGRVVTIGGKHVHAAIESALATDEDCGVSPAAFTREAFGLSTRGEAGIAHDLDSACGVDREWGDDDE